MSSPAAIVTLDRDARREALNPAESFTVRAPAGSGKTELLIQRFLSLLAKVERPESIVAITFTRKAKGEMLERVLRALREAANGAPIEKPHEAVTRELAVAALDRDQQMGWNLLQHPGRLRIQTIDSLCVAITAGMPWLSRMGGMPNIIDDAKLFYVEAARRALAESSCAEDLEVLLSHLDGDSRKAQTSIAAMLAKREQWITLVWEADEKDRILLERALTRLISVPLGRLQEVIQREVRPDVRSAWLELLRSGQSGALPDWPTVSGDALRTWIDLADLMLTKDGAWRKKAPNSDGFKRGNPKFDLWTLVKSQLERHESLLAPLAAVRSLPPPVFSDDQWKVLKAQLHILRLAVAALCQIFEERATVDFAELNIMAKRALHDASGPTDLAFQLDARLEHLLIDEFQDTSRSQFELISKLTENWTPGDGRTLFLVGDPMQSIYRFRQADVGLFLKVEKEGMGHLRPRRLDLALNYRSVPAIVERVNRAFSEIFPEDSDAQTGAVSYTRSQAASNEAENQVTFTAFRKDDVQREAGHVISRVIEARQQNPSSSIAILVRARPHLARILPLLRAHNIPFDAVDIELLESRAVVRDLLALARAMLHPADRIAWLSVLRAPYCGLSLPDMEALVKSRPYATIWECLTDLSGLSEDGRLRAQRLRETLASAQAEKGRWPIRRWVERAWCNLGGPACLEGDWIALADAKAFLDLLESEQAGGDVLDFDQLNRRIKDLFSKPLESASGAQRVQVMTIHKAKGLQFDTVIVPGLGGASKRDDGDLVAFHEFEHDGELFRLLVPIPGWNGEDELYKYVSRLERRKNELERARQLYVAITRAARRLHLCGQINDKDEDQPRPPGGTMLKDLWPTLSAEEQTSFRAGCEIATVAELPRPSAGIRLPVDWRPPELPSQVEWAGAEIIVAERPVHEPKFEWVSETLRHTGTVVHQFLQRMVADSSLLPTSDVVRAALEHAGVAHEDLKSATLKAALALEQALHSQRGRWILSRHQEGRAEYAVAGVVNGEVVRGLVDRTFVDDKGTRWIIDFKTSTHEGAGLEEFLEEEKRRYSGQMERYARIFERMGSPVRLGLYFPLLDAWREWALDENLRS